MIQDLIAYIIIAAALAAFTYRMLGFFNLTGKKSAKSGSCAGCTGGCEIKHTPFIMNRKAKRRDKYQFYL